MDEKTRELTERMWEIQEEILELLKEVKNELEPYEGAYNRATGYWIPHIEMALTHSHMYLGGSFINMEDTIHELENSGDGDD